MTTTYHATDPNGKVHTITTKRPVTVAVFLKCADGSYCAHFAKTPRQAASHWGAYRGVGLTKATIA